MEGPGPGTGRTLILAIETSCDETAAAVVSDDGEIRSNVVSSQAHLHARFGGVVPEVASRHHLELVLPVVREALGDRGLDEIDRVAVTQGPGLIGALLVGLSAAKALAWGRACRSCPSTTFRGTSPRSTSSRSRSSRPSSACSQAAGTRCCSTSRSPAPSPSSADARRRGRRGVRQGRAPPRPRLPRRRRDRPARARGRPGPPSTSP